MKLVDVRALLNKIKNDSDHEFVCHWDVIEREDDHDHLEKVEEAHGSSFFVTKNGYTPADVHAILSLKVGQKWEANAKYLANRDNEGGFVWTEDHWVKRIK
jgi:hypothetical protein